MEEVEEEEEEEEEEKKEKKRGRSTRSAAAASSTVVVDSSESVRVCIPQAYGIGCQGRVLLCHMAWHGRLRRSHACSLVSVQMGQPGNVAGNCVQAATAASRP